MIFNARAIAAAGFGLKALAIENGYFPTSVVNDTLPLQFAGGEGDSSALYAEHVGEEQMG